MKTIMLFLGCCLVSTSSFGLVIRQVVVSCVSGSAIMISLDTEAEELYYFHQWNLELIDNNLVLNACFKKGFGSTIEYLNNSFEVQTPSAQPQIFRLRVNVYYDSFQPEDLQDFREGCFQIPIEQPVIICNSLPNTTREIEGHFVTTTEGQIVSSCTLKNLWIFDEMGRLVWVLKDSLQIIDISNIENGIYFVVYYYGAKRVGLPIVIRKR